MKEPTSLGIPGDHAHLPPMNLFIFLPTHIDSTFPNKFAWKSSSIRDSLKASLRFILFWTKQRAIEVDFIAPAKPSRATSLQLLLKHLRARSFNKHYESAEVIEKSFSHFWAQFSRSKIIMDGHFDLQEVIDVASNGGKEFILESAEL